MSASSDPSPSSSAAVSHQLGLLRAHSQPNHQHLTTPPPVTLAHAYPPTTPPPVTLAHAYPPTTPPPVTLAHAYPPTTPPPPPASAPRDYRKGNWTLYETLVLITARRLDNDRRTCSVGAVCAGTSSPQPAEQRWKWVENYCWMNGCLRSQNQCNDKWDNLLRDYKKVRDYESRRAAALPDAGASRLQQQLPCYWTMERQNRKELNLPTNLAPEVYDALCDVISRRATGCGGSASAIAPSAMAPPPLALPPPPPPTSPPQPQPFPAQQHPNHSQPQPQPLLQLPPATSVSAEEETMGSSGSGSDGVGDGELKAKRQRRQRLGSSMVRGASMLARTLVACEDKRERRHQEMLELEERRLRLEVERNEMRSQGFAGLVAAISGLSDAIFALVSSDQPPPLKR